MSCMAETYGRTWLTNKSMSQGLDESVKTVTVFDVWRNTTSFASGKVADSAVPAHGVTLLVLTEMSAVQ